MSHSNPLLVIKSMYPSFHRVEKRIADYVVNNTDTFVDSNVSQIAGQIGTASSSIVRFCKIIGYSGLKELKINLAKTIVPEQNTIFEDLKPGDDAPVVLSKVFDATIRSLKNTLDTIDKESFAKAVDLLANAERIEFYGVGTSSSIAMDAYYRFMRMGLPAYAAVDPHVSRLSASKLKPNSVAVGISHTGRTKDTVDTLKIAKKQGAEIIAISTFQNNAITRLADINLIVSSSETRFMKEAITSRIAQIAVIDSLYTAIAASQYDKTMKNIAVMSDIYDDLRY